MVREYRISFPHADADARAIAYFSNEYLNIFAAHCIQRVPREDFHVHTVPFHVSPTAIPGAFSSMQERMGLFELCSLLSLDMLSMCSVVLVVASRLREALNVKARIPGYLWLRLLRAFLAVVDMSFFR